LLLNDDSLGMTKRGKGQEKDLGSHSCASHTSGLDTPRPPAPKLSSMLCAGQRAERLGGITHTPSRYRAV